MGGRGVLLAEKTSKNIFSTFLSNIFFHGQRRALQLVLYKTRYSYICCVKLAKRPDRLDWIFLLKLKLKNRKIIFFQFKKKIPLATPGFSASKQYKRSSGIVVNWTYPGSFETRAFWSKFLSQNPSLSKSKSVMFCSFADLNFMTKLFLRRAL